MRVHAQRDRGIAVAELLAHVGDWDALLKQQRRKGVPQLMWASPMQTGSIQHAVGAFRTFDSPSGVPLTDENAQSALWEP